MVAWLIILALFAAFGVVCLIAIVIGAVSGAHVVHKLPYAGESAFFGALGYPWA